ncbi:MAG: hypothetical protein Q4E83_02135 [bacterium]|nr:hypothetical protein [bacterium]
MQIDPINFRSNLNNKQKRYNIPITVGLIGVGVGSGYVAYKMSQQEKITKILTDFEEYSKNIELNKQLDICENKFFETFSESDNYLKFMEKREADALWADRKNQFEKILTKEEIIELNNLKSKVKDKVEVTSKSLFEKIDKDLIKTKKQCIGFGSCLGVGLASIFLLENFFNKNKSDNEGRHAPIIILSTLLGLVGSVVTDFIFKNATRKELCENLKLSIVKFQKLSSKVEIDYIKEFSKQIAMYPLTIRRQYLKALEAYINGTGSLDKFLPETKLEELKNRTFEAKKNLISESTQKVQKMGTSFKKAYMKKLALGTGIGLGVGILFSLLYNTKNKQANKR